MPDLISCIAASERRKHLLLYLCDGSKSWHEVQENLSVTSKVMCPQVRILEDEGLIKKIDLEYSLTDFGYALLLSMAPALKRVEILEQFAEYWKTHDLRAIPDEFLLRIDELEDLKIITTPDEEFFAPHPDFVEHIRKAKTIRIITPVIHPSTPNLFTDAVANGAQLSLIFTPQAYALLQKQFGPELAILTQSGAQIFICDVEIHFILCLTDFYFSLTLFFEDGSFDAKHGLISDSDRARVWGEDLFARFRERFSKQEIT